MSDVTAGTATPEATGRFSPAKRHGLISGLRAMSARPASAPAARPGHVKAGASGGATGGAFGGAFDFSTLPAYRELQVQRAAADMLKIDVPFFRRQDGYAGPTCVIGGREVLNFSSYNYLGLNGRPEVRKAAQDAIDRYGVSVSASRVVAGERDLHRSLERKLADLHGAEDAVAMVSGHATNVTTIAALMGPRDLILVDGLIHNSVLEGAKLSGAERRLFPHNDFGWIDDFLTRNRASSTMC